MSVSEIKLRNVLKINVLFSAVSGTFLLTYRGLANLMQANPITLMVVGGGLLFFAFIVWLAAVKKDMKRMQVLSVIVQDWIWVGTSLWVIIFQVWGLTPLGYWLIGATAIIVMTFAWLQSRYLKRIAS